MAVPPPLALLEVDWALLSGRRCVRDAVRRWARQDSALARVRSLDDVVRLTAPGTDRARADALLVALVRRARVDALAARAVLQALRPGLIRLAQRVGALGDPDATAELITLALERIRSYPLERRPRHVAANVLLDVLNARVGRRARRVRLERRLEVPTDPDRLVRHPAEAEEPPDPRPDPEELISAALATGKVRPVDVDVVRDMVVARTPLEVAARAAGVTANAIRGRRTRARRRLIEACVELVS
jgi:hypothetical protein